MLTTGERVLSTRDVAIRLGVQTWQIARLYWRGLLTEPPRLAGRRVIAEGQLVQVREALQRAGYLKSEGDVK
jgi:hypothetical protein